MLNNKVFILIFVVAVFIIGGLLYFFNPTPVEYAKPDQPEQVACTMEAKLCPDGSYVSRSGPNCEFAPCPFEDTDQKVLPPDAIFEDGTILNND